MTSCLLRRQQQQLQQQQLQQLVQVQLDDITDSQAPRDSGSGSGGDHQVDVPEPDAGPSPTYHDDTEATRSASASRDIVIDDLRDREVDSSASTGDPEQQVPSSASAAPEVDTTYLVATATDELEDQSYICDLRVEVDAEGDSSTSNDNPQEQVRCSNNAAPDVDTTGPDVDELADQSYIGSVIVRIVNPSPDLRVDEASQVERLAPENDPVPQMNDDHHSNADVDADRSHAADAAILNPVDQPQVDDDNDVVPGDTFVGDVQLDAESDEESGTRQSEPTGDRMSSPVEDSDMEVDAASTLSANVNTAHLQQRFDSIGNQNAPTPLTLGVAETASTSSESNKR